MKITFEGTWEELQLFAAKVAPAPKSNNPLDYPDVMKAIHGGAMIEAIKLYRGHTGMGLKESKDACEAVHRGA